MKQGNSLPEKQVLFLGQVNQLLHLSKIRAKGLFYNNIMSSQQGLFGVLIMSAVYQGNICCVYIGLSKKGFIISIDLGNIILLCQGLPLGLTVGAYPDSLYLYGINRF